MVNSAGARTAIVNPASVLGEMDAGSIAPYGQQPLSYLVVVNCFGEA